MEPDSNVFMYTCICIPGRPTAGQVVLIINMLDYYVVQAGMPF